MAHGIHRVAFFRQVGEYTLRVHFADGTEQVIDFSPVLTGEICAPLPDPEVFRQVCVDPESHTFVRPNGTDFDPAQLHDWPQVRHAFAKLAQSWTGAHVQRHFTRRPRRTTARRCRARSRRGTSRCSRTR